MVPFICPSIAKLGCIGHGTDELRPLEGFSYVVVSIVFLDKLGPGDTLDAIVLDLGSSIDALDAVHEDLDFDEQLLKVILEQKGYPPGARGVTPTDEE